jgi:hypothetical protein
MIRDAHDFRGRHPRPQAAQADRPGRTPRSCTGGPRLPARHDATRATCSSTTTSTCPRAASGTCPDLCVTVPVFGGRPWWLRFRAGVRPPRRHRGAVPGSMPSAADLGVRGGLMVPPIKLWDQGVPNDGGAADHDPQLADARLARRRPRRRVLGLPDGRTRASASCSRATAARRSRPASTR